VQVDRVAITTSIRALTKVDPARQARRQKGLAPPLKAQMQRGAEQGSIVERFNGHDRVALRGPNLDLTLSVKGRQFINACGQSNLPDGELVYRNGRFVF